MNPPRQWLQVTHLPFEKWYLIRCWPDSSGSDILLTCPASAQSFCTGEHHPLKRIRSSSLSAVTNQSLSLSDLPCNVDFTETQIIMLYNSPPRRGYPTKCPSGPVQVTAHGSSTSCFSSGSCTRPAAGIRMRYATSPVSTAFAGAPLIASLAILLIPCGTGLVSPLHLA